jgi:NADPH:quinone reductase-like Zn-dependent oxidoreductase
MKAIVYETYGPPDVLEFREIDPPTVGDDELLVRVCAAGINPYDWHYLRGLPYLVRLVNGVRRPRHLAVLGSDMAGVVEAVGEQVTEFGPGDEVYAEVGTGACAEYIAISAEQAGLKPRDLTFEQAAAVPMAAETALQGVRETGKVRAGHRVLINGASGGVGTFAVQIAKALGAEVTGVCSGANVDMVRSIGADHVIDYTAEDFTRSDQRFDMILDTVGNRSLSECRRVLAPKGVYGATGGGGGRWLGPLMPQLKAVLVSPFVRQRLAAVNDKPNRDLEFLNQLIDTGRLTPVIDRTFPLAETSDAMRYLLQGHARGKVVITV